MQLLKYYIDNTQLYLDFGQWAKRPLVIRKMYDKCFFVEVQCINEYEDYLKKLVHDIGGRLRTSATCTGLQCVKHGCFTTEHSLLRKHWTTEHIINGISLCQRVAKDANFSFEHQPFLISDSRLDYPTSESSLVN